MSERTRQIVLIRHGETEWSASGRHTGRTDVPLTEEGRRRAAALGECLKEWRFVKVLSSPLQRALETCTLAGLADRVEIRPELKEWDYGDFEGRTTPEIRRERSGWSLWRDGVPGGETIEQVGERADRLIAELADGSEEVAVFSHGHFLRVLAARWIDLPSDRGRSFALATASLGVLGFERETPVIVRWNQPC